MEKYSRKSFEKKPNTYAKKKAETLQSSRLSKAEMVKTIVDSIGKASLRPDAAIYVLKNHQTFLMKLSAKKYNSLIQNALGAYVKSISTAQSIDPQKLNFFYLSLQRTNASFVLVPKGPTFNRKNLMALLQHPNAILKGLTYSSKQSIVSHIGYPLRKLWGRNVTARNLNQFLHLIKAANAWYATIENNNAMGNDSAVSWIANHFPRLVIEQPAAVWKGINKPGDRQHAEKLARIGYEPKRKGKK